MARRLRIQYPGALYHVYNRGNYRRDIFETAGAAHAFETTLGEACERHAWQVHAFSIMRNHFHVALETPHANLVDGMHWLQSTYATRFNRYRSERGHLFQGRYGSPLVEDDAALLRVIDYIHLNPVEAGIVSADHLIAFRWSSLQRLVRGSRPTWLSATRLLGQLALEDSPLGWSRYVEHLLFLAANPQERERLGLDQVCQGWAIGTAGWRKAVAREHAQLALTPDLSAADIRELREARWQHLLRDLLQRWRKTDADINSASKSIRWKIELARRLRLEAGASYCWITQALKTVSPAALRVAVCRLANV